MPQMLWRISRSRGFGFLGEVEGLPEGKDGAGGTGGTSPKLAGRSSRLGCPSCYFTTGRPPDHSLAEAFLF